MLPIEDQQAIAKSISTKALASLLEDGEVKKFALQCLVDVGCKPPTHHVVLFTLTKLSTGIVGVLGGPLAKWLGERLMALPALKGFLERLESVTKGGAAKANALAMMRAQLNLADGTEPPDEADFDVVQALFAQKRFDDMDGQFALIQQAIAAQIAKQTSDNTAPVLKWPEQHGPIEKQSLTDGLRYNSKRDAFIGREAEIDLLDRFIGDPTLAGPLAMFCWMTLIGPGGEGKTRLAYEYSAILKARGWHAGRLSLADRAHFYPGRWLADKPTFIVVDYASQDGGGTASMLASLAASAAQQLLPVRVLLLERDTSGEWFKAIDANTSDGSAIRSHGAEIDGEEIWRGKDLAPLAPEAILELMAARYSEAGLSVPAPMELITAVFKVDQRGHETEEGIIPLPRALFAVATAAKLIAGELDGQDRTTMMANLEQGDVLDFIIERDRTQIWLPASGGDKDLLLLHENLLALATLCVGVPKSCLQTGAAGAGEWLPETKPKSTTPLRPDVLTAMGVANEGQINPLEPDLLGTHFVFATLDRLKANGCKGDEALINAAWELGGEATTEATLRALRDAPEKLRAYNYLAPSLAARIEAREWFQRTAVDLTSALGRKGDVEGASLALSCAQTLLGMPQSQTGAFYVSMSCTNLIGRAGAAGEWHRVETAFKLLDGLRTAFPNDAAIALEVAKSCTNLIGRAGAAGEWHRVETAFKLLDGLRTAFPNDAAIALEVASSCVNLINHAGAAGEWHRIIAILPILVEPIEQRSEQWHGVLAMRVEAGLDALLALTQAQQPPVQRIWEAICALIPVGLPHVKKGRLQFVLGPLLIVVKAARSLFPKSRVIEQVYDWMIEAGADFSTAPDILKPE
jgi:hypothetical protein